MFFRKKTRFSEDDLPSVLAACLAGDNRAQRVLINQFLGYARSISQRYTSHPHETEEIINEGFLKVFTHLDRYDPTQPFKAWLRTILVNTAVDYYRKNQRWASTLSLDDLEVIDWNDDVIAAISAQEILGMVQQLPPAYRMVFTLFVVEGYSHREIADLLNVQEGTSKSNLRDARRKLQHMIKLHYPALYHSIRGLISDSMKTERFDEEFRRKLLSLPAEADSGEVERIQDFVNANKPPLPGLGWGRLMLYGGSSLLLIGSLSYNVIQTYRNNHLQSSIDSLSHRPVGPAASGAVSRHDTVYITRSGNATGQYHCRGL